MDYDGLTTCHVFSVSHSYVILVKFGRLGGVCDASSGIKREWCVCMCTVKNIYYLTDNETHPGPVWPEEYHYKGEKIVLNDDMVETYEVW
jgi:hypothetical protein